MSGLGFRMREKEIPQDLGVPATRSPSTYVRPEAAWVAERERGEKERGERERGGIEVS